MDILRIGLFPFCMVLLGCKPHLPSKNWLRWPPTRCHSPYFTAKQRDPIWVSQIFQAQKRRNTFPCYKFVVLPCATCRRWYDMGYDMIFIYHMICDMILYDAGHVKIFMMTDAMSSWNSPDYGHLELLDHLPIAGMAIIRYHWRSCISSI